MREPAGSYSGSYSTLSTTTTLSPIEPNRPIRGPRVSRDASERARHKSLFFHHDGLRAAQAHRCTTSKWSGHFEVQCGHTPPTPRLPPAQEPAVTAALLPRWRRRGHRGGKRNPSLSALERVHGLWTDVIDQQPRRIPRPHSRSSGGVLPRLVRRSGRRQRSSHPIAQQLPSPEAPSAPPPLQRGTPACRCCWGLAMAPSSAPLQSNG
jgi:hypothetical protein